MPILLSHPLRKKHERKNIQNIHIINNNSNNNAAKNALPHHKQKATYSSSSEGGATGNSSEQLTNETDIISHQHPHPPNIQTDFIDNNIIHSRSDTNIDTNQSFATNANIVLSRNTSMMSQVSCTKSTPRRSGKNRRPITVAAQSTSSSVSSSSKNNVTSPDAVRVNINDHVNVRLPAHMNISTTPTSTSSVHTSTSTNTPSQSSRNSTVNISQRNPQIQKTSSPSSSSTPVSPSASLAIPRLSKNLPPFPYRSNQYNTNSMTMAMSSSHSSSQSNSQTGQSLNNTARGSRSVASNNNMSALPFYSAQGGGSGASNNNASASPFSSVAGGGGGGGGAYEPVSLATPSSSPCYNIKDEPTTHPARLQWNVQDSKLKPIPPMHPPLHVNNTTFVDASPSIVASRIGSCLKKRSLLVEYDEDAAVATVFTKERGCFVIQLYRGGRINTTKIMDKSTQTSTSTHNRSELSGGSGLQHLNSPYSVISSMSAISNTSERSENVGGTGSNIMPDFSHGVIVECVRIRGDVIAFHRHCRAVLSCARSDSDGLDDFRSDKVALLHPPYGFGCRNARAQRGMAHKSLSCDEIHALEQDAVPNLIQLEHHTQKQKQNHSSRNSNSNANVNGDATAATFAALEHSLEFLEKDRLDANLLGIQSLVLLTDQGISGVETAYLASLSVLNSAKDSKWKSSTGSSSSSLGSAGSGSVNGGATHHHHRSLVRLHDKVMALLIGKFTSPKRFVSLDYDSEEDDGYSTGAEAEQTTAHNSESIVAEYNVTIRSHALQVLTNALTNVIYHREDFPLLPMPSCDELMTNEFLQKIASDLAGATRPPVASLGSAHEAALASRFVHLIAAYSEQGYCFANEAMVGFPPRPIHGLLQRAHHAGLLTHRALELETQVALTALGGEF